MDDIKIKALAAFLDIDESRITKAEDKWFPDSWKDCDYEVDGDYNFLVANDKEADAIAKEEIENSLWAFKAEFIVNHSSALKKAGSRAETALTKMQEMLCEDANELVRAMIDDIDEFVEDAVSEDGRGSYIARYDGNENEVSVDRDDFNIYCLDIDEVEKEIEEERE